MRDYMRKYPEKYRLPREVYHQTIWRIRDYYRLKSEADAVLTESPAPPDGQPGAHGKNTDEVARKAERREKLMEQIWPIEEALRELPAEYRKGVWANVHWGTRFPNDAGRATYGRYKARFIFLVAEKSGLI